jgi:hypothetical protein
MAQSRLWIAVAAVAALASCSREECRLGSVACGGVCTRLAVDSGNCGACGVVCAAGEVCSGGTCAATCGAPLSECGVAPARFCADLRTDPAHCGACGEACPVGQVCSAGLCVETCAAPLTTCGAGADAFCADLRSDPAHCGACGTTCGAGETCASGECVDTCVLAGAARCGATCADLESDPAHCGTCDTACGASEVCRAGGCVDTCELAGTARCADACVDLRTDPGNCGACGNACPEWGVCVAGACAPALCSGGVSLPDAVPLTLSASSPDRLLLVDLNGDGREDLVVFAIPWVASELHVALALPDGWFAPLESYALAHAGALVASDFDGDGDVDLHVSGSASSTLLANDGTGHFTVRPPVANGYDEGSLAIRTDLDGDGAEDEVRVWGMTVQVRLATSPFVQSFPDSFSHVWTVRAADLTGDGRPEIVVAYTQSFEPVGVLLNGGDGTFTSVRYPYDLYSNIDDLELGDVDLDGDADVVLMVQGALAVARNDGAGALGELETSPTPAGASVFPRYDLLLADVDADGDPDALMGDASGIAIAGNAGDGTFEEWHHLRSGQARGLAAADVDRDGRLDLLGANAMAEGVTVALGRGYGTFAMPETRTDLLGGLLVADLDLDGRDDFVSVATSALPAGTTIAILRSGASAPQVYPAPDLDSLAVADVDRDGFADLVAGRWQSSPLVLRNRGDGTFDPASAVSDVVGTPVLAADLTGDGATDLVALHEWDHLIRVAVGRGDGTFAAVDATTPLPYFSRAALGDVDGDGRADVVVATDFSGVKVRVHRSNGDGTLAAAAERAIAGHRVAGIVADDLDGDGLADVALLIQQGSEYDDGFSVAILYSDAGVLQAPTSHPMVGKVYGIAAAQVSGGRRRDLIATDSFYSGLALLTAEGERGYAPVRRFALPLGGSAVAGADLDGDLRDEIVVGSSSGLTIFRTACGP